MKSRHLLDNSLQLNTVNKRRGRVPSSSDFSSNSTHSVTFDMAAEAPNPTRVVVLGDYVIPQGPRNRFAIVLSLTAQQMEIKSYSYNLILTN